MKPYVISHMMGTVDGRTIAKGWPIKNASKYFEGPAAKIKADAWLVGRVTMQEFCSKKKGKLKKSPERIPKVDFVGEHSAKTFCVAIDPEGKCRWDTNMVTTEHVIEVLTEKVTSDYLYHLRSKNVSYIFAGKTSLDLKVALRKLAELFKIKTVRVDGGGHVNGSFLKARLIDEFSFVLAPVADGRTGMPTVFEAGEDLKNYKPSKLKLKSLKKIEKDFIWLRYEVEK